MGGSKTDTQGRGRHKRPRNKLDLVGRIPSTARTVQRRQSGAPPTPGPAALPRALASDRRGQPPAPQRPCRLPAVSGCFPTRVCTSLSRFLMRENQAVITGKPKKERSTALARERSGHLESPGRVGGGRVTLRPRPTEKSRPCHPSSSPGSPSSHPAPILLEVKMRPCTEQANSTLPKPDPIDSGTGRSPAPSTQSSYVGDICRVNETDAADLVLTDPDDT